MKAFYRSANVILCIEGMSNNLIMLQLLKLHCASVLIYKIEVIDIADADIRRKMRVALNQNFVMSLVTKPTNLLLNSNSENSKDSHP